MYKFRLVKTMADNLRTAAVGHRRLHQENMKRMHKFRVWCETRPGEHLAVTGSSPELGLWSKPGIVLLDQTENRDVWEKCVELTEEAQQYRYCVVVLLHQGRMVVRRWENHTHPRRVMEEAREDVFGKVDGVVSVQRGWLTEEILLQFKLKEAGLNIWKRKYAGHRLWIKITPVDQGVCDVPDLDESLDVAEIRQKRVNYPIVETAELSKENAQLQVQNQFGVEYVSNSGTFVLFEVQILNLNSVAFLVDIYSRPVEGSEDDLPHHVGMSYIYSEALRETDGKVEATIMSMKYQPIGRLQMDYLCIKPVEGLECDFSTSKRTLWSNNWGGLDVGHRGLGNSYTSAQHCSNIRENTIASMKDAVLHGADMVEFDVQVSADLVPVIYHEFTLCVQSKTKQGNEIMLEIPVKDITINQLHDLKVHHPSEKSAGVKTFEKDDVDHQPFPSLETALTNLDMDCGFNIEIKFSQQMKDGRQEHKQMMEMNLFIDQVLKTVFNHGDERKIIFSSFAPDVCSMLVSKQNRYPVLLLTQGTSTKYDDYMDPRTWTVPAAVWFGKMVGLLGTSAMAEDVLKDNSLVEFVKSQDQVLFCWTDDQNDRETVQYLKSLGVHGIIYDRMDQNNSKQVKESVFLQERRRVISDSGCSSDSSPASSPLHNQTQL